MLSVGAGVPDFVSDSSKTSACHKSVQPQRSIICVSSQAAAEGSVKSLETV